MPCTCGECENTVPAISIVLCGPRQSPPPPQLGQSEFVSPSFAPSSPLQTSFLPARLIVRKTKQQTPSILVAALSLLFSLFVIWKISVSRPGRW